MREKYSYDIDKYDFVQVIENLYDVCDLDLIHTQWENAIDYEILDNVKTDQNTIYHKHFYNNIHRTNWYEVYKKFITEVIQPLFNESILYQKIPTFRVHQPNNLAVAAFHRDSDYSHSIHEVNFFLPLTDDFQPMVADVGEFWKWSGANLLHGNKLNDTGVSRVSVDFRVLPVSKYEENNKVSITNNTKMVIGDYWEALHEK
jgi:hypothetical protein